MTLDNIEHISPGDKSKSEHETFEVMKELLIQLKITNYHLAIITEEMIIPTEIEIEVD